MKRKSKIPYIRKQQHYKYVESRAVEQRERIIKSAILFGTSDPVHSELFMKYSEYLIKLKQK